MLRCDEAALGGGTVITVRDLFYNVPARRKFLRTEQTELAHIASLVTHYSLAHPDKTFPPDAAVPPSCCTSRRWPRMRERVYQVFGSQMLDELVEIGVRERDLFMPPPSVPPSQAIAEYRSAEPEEPPFRRFRLQRLLLAAAGAEGQSQFDLHLRERPADPRPPAAARALRRPITT